MQQDVQSTEIRRSDAAVPPQASPPPRKFSQLTGKEKLAFMGKLVIFFMSLGYIYPLLLTE